MHDVKTYEATNIKIKLAAEYEEPTTDGHLAMLPSAWQRENSKASRREGERSFSVSEYENWYTCEYLFRLKGV